MLYAFTEGLSWGETYAVGLIALIITIQDRLTDLVSLFAGKRKKETAKPFFLMVDESEDIQGGTE